MKNEFIKKFVFVFCSFLLFSASFIFANSDDDFLQALNLEEFNNNNETHYDIVIKDIEINISGTTRKDWVYSKLIIKTDTEYSEDKIRNLMDTQKNYFRQSKLFYSVDVYLLPLVDIDKYDIDIEEETKDIEYYKLYVDLSDGFMHKFGFTPYDAIWGLRHLENGDELLEIQAGYNTQRVSYDRPNLYDVFSIYSYVAHYYGDFDLRGEKYHTAEAKLRPYLSFSIWADVGLNVEYDFFKFVSSTEMNHVFKVGLFADIAPKFNFLNPVSFNIFLDGGRIMETSGDMGWYFDVRLKLLFKVVSFFSISLRSDLNYTSEGISRINYTKTDIFRSTTKLQRRNVFNYNCLEIKFDRVLSWHIVITDLSLTPIVYAEGSSSADRFDSTMKDYKFAVGGGITVGFDNPVNAFFTFGVKYGIGDRLPPGFLFEAKADLY